MKALTDEESDAMEQKFPCYIHGMLKMEACPGVIRPKDTDGPVQRSTCPRPRRPQQIAARGPLLAHAGRGHGRCPALPGRLSLRLHRADAQPLPAHGHHAEGPAGHEAEPGGRSARSGPTSTPRKSATTAERAKQWKRYDRNPVFDEDEVRKMVKDGVERLTEMQLSDGGWGWFSGWGEQSWPHTTALVVHGLQLARQNDVALVPGMLERGVDWLQRYQDEQIQLLKNAAIKNKPAGTALEGARRRAGRLRLHGPGRRRREERRDARFPLSRPHQDRRLRLGHVRHRPGEAGREGEARHGPAEHQPVRPAGRREPDRLAQPAGRLLVVLVRQRVRGRGLLPEAPGADRSQGRAGLAAGQVPAQQPQERHLLELDPRHGDRASRPWPSTSRPAASRGRR